ncbi:hypothetical protein [Acidocella sp.]|uniref:hypothetical protein n=1 Tax=Acidocella sp. TaxID=50710 RepID=UPI00260C0DD7|nr:hypothetical protein [Acidocella sp.]
MPTKFQPGFMLWAVPRFHRQAENMVDAHTRGVTTPDGSPAKDSSTSLTNSDKLRFFSGLGSHGHDMNDTTSPEPNRAQRAPALQH